VLRARAGDAAAFAQLAERHGPRLLRFLQTMSGCDHTAEDLRQDALRTAFEKLAQIDEPSRFPSWLRASAVNGCRHHLRRAVQRAHEGTRALVDVADRGRRTALSSLVRRESAEQLALAIDRLPILLREAFVLFAVEGLPYAEIAAATGAAEGTLQVRVHRAKALLRQQLGAVVDTWRSDAGR
jgi:RNA polymerase sigma-70 factor (ECF subfamily)